jgi:hypothetical protein
MNFFWLFMKLIIIFLFFLNFSFTTLYSNELIENKECRLEKLKNVFFLVRPSNPQMGMFAAINMVLGHLHLYETGYYSSKGLKGFSVDFGNEGNYYDEKIGPNWWNYFFEPLTVGSCDKARVLLSTSHNELAWTAKGHLERKYAHYLLTKYVHIKPYLLEKVELFQKEHFKDFFLLGVHYRGTDKFQEAPEVSYVEVEEALLKEINKLQDQNYKIYVATDDAGFLNFAQKKFPGKILNIEAFRIEDSRIGIHHLNLDPFPLGEQAMMDAILLSRCDVLVRMSSNLSQWSSFLNPDLPVVLLNEKYGGE